MENNQNMQHEELTRMVEPEVVKMSAVQRIISIFAAPGELMRNIKVYPVILVPFLVSVVIGLIAIIPTLPATEMVNQELSHISIERYGVDLLDFTAADEYGDLELGATMDAIQLVSLVAMAFVLPLLVSFIGTLIIFILSKILRGKATFGRLFSMCMHIYVISAVGSVVVAVLMVLTGSIVDVTSLAAIVMPQGRLDMVSYNALAAIALFPIWAAILEFIGVKILNEFSNVKAGIVIAIGFAIYVAIHVVLAMLTWWTFDLMIGMGAI